MELNLIKVLLFAISSELSDRWNEIQYSHIACFSRYFVTCEIEFNEFISRDFAIHSVLFGIHEIS
jgi:hypothetical protein